MEGAPIRIPHVYNGKDKTFFFAYFEGLRNRQGQTQNTGVPSLLERTGDFSQSPVKPINPVTRQPYLNNQLPSINPASAKLLPLYPNPNSSSRTFSSSPSLVQNRNAWGMRIDHRISTQDTLFGRYLYSRDDQQQPFAPFGATVPGFPGTGLVTPQTVTVGETHIFGPHLINDVRGSFLRLNFASPLFTRRDKLADFGFSYAPTSPAYETVPVVQITGLSSLGNPQGPSIRVTNTYEFREAVSYSNGTTPNLGLISEIPSTTFSSDRARTANIVLRDSLPETPWRIFCKACRLLSPRERLAAVTLPAKPTRRTRRTITAFCPG